MWPSEWSCWVEGLLFSRSNSFKVVAPGELGKGRKEKSKEEIKRKVERKGKADS